MDKQELDRKVEEAHGYTDYWRKQYDHFSEYIAGEVWHESHRRQKNHYQESASKLQKLVYKVYDELNE